MLIAGATSYMSAQQRNRAARAGYGGSMIQYQQNLDALEGSRKVTTEQVEASSEVEQYKNYLQGITIAGRAKAMLAEAGTTSTMGGTGDRIITQTHMDRLRNARYGDENKINAIKKINSDYMAGGVGASNQYIQTTQSYYSQMQNPIFAALTGGMQGYAIGNS